MGLRRYIPEVIPDFDPIGGSGQLGAPVYGDVRAELPTYEDAFGNAITRNTFNDADLASHYRFTPERWRLYKNGTRELIHYDIDASNDLEDNRAGDEDVFVLTPSAGDTLQLKTAERFRYTVNYVSQVSQAFALNASLSNTNDRVTVGLDTSPDGDMADGYFLEHLPTHADDEVDLFIKRQGSVVGDRETVTLQKDVTNFQRFENEFNWYNVGQSEWTETATITSDDGTNKLRNFLLGALSVIKGDSDAGTGGRGPISGNGHIVYEVEADASTTGLELICGSASFTTLGGVGASIKTKGAESELIDVTQTTDYEPLFALRRDPDRPNVNLGVQSVEITNGVGQCIAIACNSSEVLDGNGNELTDADFTRPETHSQNSVAQTTNGTAVAQFPNSTGATVTTAADPGGYQLAFDSTREAKKTERTGDLQEKHGVYDGDLAVFLALPDDANTDYRVFYTAEMDE